MSAAHVARELLKRENALTRNDTDLLAFSVGLEDDTDFFKWRACFEGPPDSLYEGGENNLWADLFGLNKESSLK